MQQVRMASSMVTVDLNKSEAFIKSNAMEIHTRELKFINNQKLYLDEENEILPVVKGQKRYVQCPVFGYFETTGRYITHCKHDENMHGTLLSCQREAH